jgi:hypothetical protein
MPTIQSRSKPRPVLLPVYIAQSAGHSPESTAAPDQLAYGTQSFTEASRVLRLEPGLHTCCVAHAAVGVAGVHLRWRDEERVAALYKAIFFKAKPAGGTV